MKQQQDTFCAAGIQAHFTPALLSAVSDFRRPKLASASPVPFERNLAQTGGGISHQPGTAEFLLHTPGFYEINYSASIMSPASREAGALLILDGETIPGTYSEDRLCPCHPTGQLSGMAIVEICAPARLCLLNAASETIYSSAAICIRQC